MDKQWTSGGEFEMSLVEKFQVRSPEFNLGSELLKKAWCELKHGTCPGKTQLQLWSFERGPVYTE